MNGKSANGTVGGMACIEGLPPLPKSLSGLLNSSGGSWREMERMYVKKTMIQDDLSRGRNNADNLLTNKPANLDAALALLRKEMVTCLLKETRFFLHPCDEEQLNPVLFTFTEPNSINNSGSLACLACRQIDKPLDAQFNTID